MALTLSIYVSNSDSLSVYDSPEGRAIGLNQSTAKQRKNGHHNLTMLTTAKAQLGYKPILGTFPGKTRPRSLQQVAPHWHGHDVVATQRRRL